MNSPPAPSARLRFHWVRLRASCHGTEDPERVTQAMATVAGVPVLDLAGQLKRTPLESHHGGQVLLLEAVFEKNREAKAILDRLLQLPGARDQIQRTLDARVDDEGVLYARVEKQAACLGEVKLTEGDDAIQLRFRVESYPAGKESAMGALSAGLADAAELV